MLRTEIRTTIIASASANSQQLFALPRCDPDGSAQADDRHRHRRPNQVWRDCRVDARDHSPAAVLLGDRRETIVATTVTR
jgi:hypothetical protein